MADSTERIGPPELARSVHMRAPTFNWGSQMRGIFRGLLAGWGASKLGGGCISTIIIFLILYWLLGQL
jgi:hypothetical protein